MNKIITKKEMAESMLKILEKIVEEIDWDAVHEKLIEVWHRDISADEALDEIKYLIKPMEDKLKENT